MLFDNPIPNDKKSDHLILLVGGNPLPNAVAAQLLANDEATIWLLHSDGAGGEPSTKRIAENLELFLQSKNNTWCFKLEPIPSSNNVGIENRVQEILSKIPIDSHVGLHYTGGTKSMSVHVYRALEKASANKRARPIFSYLDPRQLALHIDRYGTESDQIYFLMRCKVLRQALKISVDQLAQLHGYKRVDQQNVTWAKPENTPGLIELCRAIACLNSSERGHRTWKQWVYREQLKELPTSASNPGLEKIIAGFAQLCAVDVAQLTPEMVAAKLLPGRPGIHLTACQEWFRAHWLEEYVLWCIQQSTNYDLHSIEKGLHYKLSDAKDDFELDVVALIGYQLFVFSCITTGEKDKAKEHLLEAFVRARQLGGDEARIALVCCYEDQQRLQSEVARSWDAQDKVKVFGRPELGKLSEYLSDWFRQAIR